MCTPRVPAGTGLPPKILEKDVWLCWTLDVLFSQNGRLQMAFKGGTSLSKVYGVIDRFSEDIDLTVALDPDANAELPSTRSAAKKVRERLGIQLKSHLEEVTEIADGAPQNERQRRSAPQRAVHPPRGPPRQTPTVLRRTHSAGRSERAASTHKQLRQLALNVDATVAAIVRDLIEQRIENGRISLVGERGALSPEEQEDSATANEE